MFASAASPRKLFQEFLEELPREFPEIVPFRTYTTIPSKILPKTPLDIIPCIAPGIYPRMFL